MPKPGYKSLTLKQELVERLRRIARRENKKISELIEEMIENIRPLKEKWLVLWDIPTEKRNLFYYYFKSWREKGWITGWQIQRSVFVTNDRKSKDRLLELASKFGYTLAFKVVEED